jgi:hypothetical protein
VLTARYEMILYVKFSTILAFTGLNMHRVIVTVTLSTLGQGCTSTRCQVAMATKFCTVAPNVCGCSEWNVLHVIHLVPRIFRVGPGFLENLCTPALEYYIKSVFVYLQCYFQHVSAFTLP